MDRPPIDRSADRPVFKQVADDLRKLIGSGVLEAGQLLPRETALMEDYQVSRNSVREALAVLRSEGLVETIARVGTRIRVLVEPIVVEVGPAARVSARMPTEGERRRLDVPVGVPVLVVVVPGEDPRTLRADRYALIVREDPTLT